MKGLLDWVAAAYFDFYCRFMQRPPGEPYTAQAARMNIRWPAFTWGFALALLFVLARFTHDWWLMLAFLVFLFSSWWFEHIVRYRCAHPENKPFRLIDWAADRITGKVK